jgi:FkbM family methyltransferase
MDVGANIGLFSLYCIKNFKCKLIIAIEPLPPIYDVLKRNLSSHKDTQIILLNIGIVYPLKSSNPFASIPTSTTISNNDTTPRHELFYYYSTHPGESTRHLNERTIQRQLLYNDIQNNKNSDMFNNEDNDVDQIIQDITTDTPTLTYECKVMTLEDTIQQLNLKRIDLLKVL